jgi:kynurenine formamidase
MNETRPGFSITNEEFHRTFEKLRNWGRWGDDDELGTLNFLGEAEVAQGVKLAKRGRRLSLGRPLDTVAGPDNSRPALHYMTHMGDRRADEPTYYMDFIGVDFHGKSASHIDGLAHIAYKGMLYNGRLASEVVGSTGSSFSPISRMAHGVVARGVLLDAARARGVDWVEPPAALEAEDLDAIAGSLGVEVRRGDAVLVRSGQMRRRQTLGPWDPDRAGVGLAISAMEWLAQRQVAILGGDGDSDARPSPVEGVGGPIHALAIAAMGMCLLDNLDLESLSEACSAAGTFEFLFFVAPLVVPGGTGSPVNPIAVL